MLPLISYVWVTEPLVTAPVCPWVLCHWTRLERKPVPASLNMKLRRVADCGVRQRYYLPLSPDTVVPRDFDLFKLEELREEQQNDAELAFYFAQVGRSMEKVGGKEEFSLRKGVLCRSWVEDSGGELAQVVVPGKFCQALVMLAHKSSVAGHLSAGETVKLREKFWWPGMAACISAVLRGCRSCQVVGKPTCYLRHS